MNADAVAVGSGEGTFEGTEEFAFEEGRGDGAAVDGDEGFIGASGVAMDHAGDELFAGAGFAFDEDVGFGGGDLGEGLIDFDHAGGGADHVGIGDIVDAGFFFVGFEQGSIPARRRVVASSVTRA